MIWDLLGPQEWNATLVGEIVFINLLLMLFFTVKFAKGKADNLPLVGFYTVLISLLLMPASWFYCYYWAKKTPVGG